MCNGGIRKINFMRVVKIVPDKLNITTKKNETTKTITPGSETKIKIRNNQNEMTNKIFFSYVLV